MKPLLLILALVASANAQQPVSKEQALDLAGNVHVIFEHKCNECHGAHLKKPEGKFGHVLDLKRMADNAEYIVRGKPAQSEMYRLVNEGEMPPDDHPKTPPLTGDEKDIVRRWIQAGAPHELPAVLPKRSFATASPASANAAINVKTKRITLEVRDRPAGEVFADIDKQSGLQLHYTAPQHEPRLSITLKNGTIAEALDYLILCGNLTLTWDGATAKIGPNPPPQAAGAKK